MDFNDPLFAKIGSEFINQQSKYYTASHVYQCDTFNEMDPSSSDEEYLKSASFSVYNAMYISDNDAIWLMQGWL